jgi:hypothetical protein
MKRSVLLSLLVFGFGLFLFGVGLHSQTWAQDDMAESVLSEDTFDVGAQLQLDDAEGEAAANPTIFVRNSCQSYYVKSWKIDKKAIKECIAPGKDGKPQSLKAGVHTLYATAAEKCGSKAIGHWGPSKTIKLKAGKKYYWELLCD